MPLQAPKHVNDELLVAISIDWVDGAMIELAAIPLNSDFHPNKKFRMYHTKMKPSVIKQTTASHQRYGLDQHVAGDLFIRWFDNHKLAPLKRIVPVAHQWHKLRPILIDWLGQLNFDHCFSAFARDTFTTAQFLNDSVGFQMGLPMFTNKGIKGYARKLGIPIEGRSALEKAQITAEAYRQMILRFAFSGNVETPEVHELPDNEITDARNSV